MFLKVALPFIGESWASRASSIFLKGILYRDIVFFFAIKRIAEKEISSNQSMTISVLK
jgi:hypothetical protein